MNIAGALTDVLLEKGLQLKHNLVMRPHLSVDGLLKQHLVGSSEDKFLRSHRNVWHSRSVEDIEVVTFWLHAVKGQRQFLEVLAGWDSQPL